MGAVADRHTGPVTIRLLLLALAVSVTAAASCSEGGAGQGSSAASSSSPETAATGHATASDGGQRPTGAGCDDAPGPGRYVVSVEGGELEVTDQAGTPVDVGIAGLPDSDEQAALLAALALDQRTIHVAVPDGAGPHEVVLDFHGYSGNAAQQLSYSRLGDVAVDAGYLVVAIDGRDDPRRWELTSTGTGLASIPSSDVAVVDAATEVVLEAFCGDPEAVHAAGMSNGSVFAAVLACHSDLDIQAVASVAFTTGTAGCDADRQIPSLAIHGTTDVVVPYHGRDLPLIEAVLGWQLEPAEQAMATKAALNGCDAFDDEPIGADVVRRTWRDCDAATVLYRIEGGGHGWPGPGQPASGLGRSTTTIDATELIVDFFDRH